jgi:alcohol dehydrogenase
MDLVIANELEILGSHGMQAFKYPEMLEMIKAGRLSPEKLIERTISLEESVRILPEMNQFKNSGITVINSFM